MVGAGVFGGFHAGKYAAHPRARFAGVYDPHPERAAALAGKHEGARAFGSLEDLLAACDAITVASPASSHGADALAALAAGCHVLVEKPLAAGAVAARDLVDKAAEAGLPLHAGHQERFIARAAGLFDVPPPVKIAARRFTAPGERGLDVSVVMDLMIHDIDMAFRLIGSPPVDIRGAGTANEAVATIRFENGAYAEFAAGRRAPFGRRFTSFQWADGGVAHIDYLEKAIHNHSSLAFNTGFADMPEAQDSLGANVDAFIRSILDGAPAVAPGREAAAAAAAAEAIEHAVGLHAGQAAAAN